MLPIILPEYRIKAETEIRYAAWNGTYLEQQTITLAEEWEPTLENAKQLIALYVPQQWQAEVRSIFFEADQPLNKIRYGQSVWVDDVSQVLTFEYSYIVHEYKHHNEDIQKRSFRRNTENSQSMMARLYIK